MSRPARLLLLIASLAALAAVPQLACCAGLVDLHGMPSFSCCCESAGQDAEAEDCCDGTETWKGPGQSHEASLVGLPVAVRLAIPVAAHEHGLPGLKLPIPIRNVHLYTLHASLLI